jgi:ubiquinone/menaquinone biosynthesis C-methylase UbiE
MLADLVGEAGSVTGVDVNRERLAACRKLLRKYKSSRSRLVLGDGTTFDTRVADWMCKAHVAMHGWDILVL